MAETIVRTFSLLKDTDHKLEEMTRLTFRRNKGDVIDWLVGEAWQKIQESRVPPVSVVDSIIDKGN